MTDLHSIPVNIITGFLGVGKTTAILHLLKHKPADERWAVLVNEFGEVGIDGSLYQGNHATDEGIFIREVPGGCMCCSAGLPMQIALNMLLSRAKPHRLLIEPTGLGHPNEIINTLKSEHYRGVLDINATLTLVDARKIQDERYTRHDTFNQQLAIADVIVANKADQYGPEDFSALHYYLEQKGWLPEKAIHQCQMGQIQLPWLSLPAVNEAKATTTTPATTITTATSTTATSPAQTVDHPSHASVLHRHHSDKAQHIFTAEPELPDCGYVSIQNQGDGFYSHGWIFKPSLLFCRRKLFLTLSGVDADRIKAVFITTEGTFAYNKADNALTEYAINEAADSRIECIAITPTAFDNLEQALLQCLT